MQQATHAIKEGVTLLTAHPGVGVVGASGLATLNFLYGTGITLTAALIFMAVLALDWIAGLRASKKDGSYASEYGIDGAFRTAFILLTLSLSYRVDLALGLPNVLFFFFIGNFGLHIWKSMTANVVRAGWERWVPIQVLDMVADEIEHKTARAERRKEEKAKYLKEDEE
ncbi:phage holin family protein [Bacillus sp. Hm123]|uniref:phage holin family protein n=1 Tax=Bacillus sp. Hm123 TaxID=3450745 RepID=UPI003F44503F